MRLGARSLAMLALSASVITCTDSSVAPLEPQTGSVTVDPDFSATASAIAQRMTEFGITIDTARFILVRGVADTVLDSVVDVDVATALALRAFPVTQHSAQETYAATVILMGPAGAIYRGTGVVTAQGTAVVTLGYVGPGANVVSITVSASKSALNGVDSTSLVVSAVTASGDTVTSPVKWTTSDSTIATVSAAGAVESTGKRGASTIGAETPTFATGSTVVTVTPVPTSIVLASGGSQSAPYGTVLPVRTVVAANAADGLGVAGLTVTFAAPNGGSVSPATAVTDSSGLASTTITLGGTVGAQTFTAAAAALGVVIPETAVAGPAATISTTGGDAQSATILTALPTLLTVAIADAAGNGVSGAVVRWARVGSGVLRDSVSSSDAAGIATNLYTMGSVAGSETISASVAGIATPARFTATATPGAAAALALTTVPTVGTAGAPISAVSVTVRDAAGNTAPVAIPVTIAMTAGSGPADATLSGTTTRTSVAGVATFDDLVLNKSAATYTLTVTSGGVSSSTSAPIVISAGTAATMSVVAGASQAALVNSSTATAPSVKIVDANGNAVAGALVAFAPSGNGSVLPATPVATDTTGVATLTSWTLGTVAGAQSLVASVARDTVTFQATAQPRAPAALVLVTQPSATAETNIALAAQPVVKLVDEFGNDSPASGVVITATPNSGTATGNSVAVSSTTGIATFTNLVLTANGSVTVRFSSNSTLPLSTSSTVLVNPPPISGLSLTGIPTMATNNERFASPLEVQLLDQSSHPLARPDIVVTMTAIAASGSSVTPPTLLVGTGTTITAATDANGIATFTGIRPVGLAQNFALSFAATVGPTVTSSTIALGVGAPMKIGVVSGNNQTGLIGATLPTAVRADVLDTLGQVTTAAATVSFTASDGGSAPAPVTASGGQADASWTLGSAEGAQTLTASIVGSSFGSATFSATASDVHAITIIQTPSASIRNGIAIPTQPTLQLRTADGVTNLRKAGVTVTATAVKTDGSAASQTLSGATAVSDASGLATFTSLSVLGSVGDIVLHFDVTSGTTQTIPTRSASVTIVAGAPTIASLGSDRVVLKDQPSLAANLRPAVQFRDVSGNAVGDASAASATFTVTAGACTIPGGTTTVTVDTLGQAKIPDASLTIPAGNAFSCRVHATTDPALSGSFDFDIVVAALSGRAWLGGTSREFARATNWSGAIAPGSSDAIFIPSTTPNSPQLQTGASVGALAMETGATLDIATANTLTVAGSIDAATVTNGALEATGATGNIRGTFTAVALTFGDGTNPCAYTLNGTVTATAGSPATSGNVTLANCAVTVSDQTLAIGRDLSVTGTNGKLVMLAAAGKVTVAGAATFNGASTSAAMTAGSLEIAGNFQQSAAISSSSFAPSAAHITKLTGSGAQSVNFASPASSHFYKLDVTNRSTSGVTITSIVDVASDATIGASARVNGTASGGGKRLTVGGALTAATTANLGGLDSVQITGNTFPSYANTTAGSAPAVTQLTGAAVALAGNATVAGGLDIGTPGTTGTTLNISGHTLTIMDSLIVDDNLDMLSATPNAVVAVGGTARFRGGSLGGHLEAGSLKVGGDFIEEGTTASFAPAAGFLVQLNGASTGQSQQVSFAHPGAASSHFTNLEIDNTKAGIAFASDVTVSGTLEQKGVLAVELGRTATVAGTSSFRTLGGSLAGASTDISGTLHLGSADFYNGSNTVGSGTLDVATCRMGTAVAGSNLLVGTSFNVLSCSRIGLP